MKIRFFLLVAAAVGAVGLLAALVLHPGHPPAPRPLLRPDDTRVVMRGERLYQAHCASCHGANLEGQADWREPGADGLLPAPPHDQGGHTWHHPDELLLRITKYGVAKAAGLPEHKSAMPAFEGVLSDEEIVAVLSWIKSKWPDAVREKHDKINAQYRAAQRP
ncbi:c-type cytochrome [Azohydromonas caseinilytica]|uniref:Cytochrome c n=1 Tax=Azohydromonas caseinilytica TaxID=2728836 RepID=A0A848F6P0_9BURK|nr:cytochrome c [Azohydromonas caseinilytica]NML13940.1 cytochrome c [Azohydromonas caseinilytica]